MSASADFDEDTARTNYRAPYSKNRPIPTIQRYREHRHELDEQHNNAEEAQHSQEDDSKTKRAFNSVKSIVKDEDKKHPGGDPYPTGNRHTTDTEVSDHDQDDGVALVPRTNNDGAADTYQENGTSEENEDGKDKKDGKNGKKKGKELSATEKASGTTDAKQKRKEMKHNKRDDGGREVTDPVTHLPLIIRDSTDKDLRRAPENVAEPGKNHKTATGLSGASKSRSQLNLEEDELQDGFDGMQKVFPPPNFNDTNAELIRTYQFAFSIGIGVVVLLASSVVLTVLFLTSGSVGSSSDRASMLSWTERQESSPRKVFIPLAISIIVALGAGLATVLGIRGWLANKVKEIWQDEIWDAARANEFKLNNTTGKLPESVAWMNSLLSSVWPLINPDLFAGIVDMLEDVMQASLPKVVRMVSIDDIGQGSESIRILGIRWLPTGAAGQTVGEDGSLKKASNDEKNDRTTPGEDQEENSDDDKPVSDEERKSAEERKQKEEDQQAIREGMEAEQGDFVNMELAFAYRARSSGKSLKSKVKNAHLYLKFYLPGGIFVPVWVELRGIIGTVRLRLQLTPDPPFFSLCTLTFLGQPRADLSCVPLSKHLPNLMNVPLISSFVQSSIDAALAEYVAPRSLTLDLKDMLVGDDFKKDTVSRGVIFVLIKKARGFKEGDGGIGPLAGSSDSYITCSWGKFGKTLSSTRIIKDDQEPNWHEWSYILVSPQEIDAEEKLRIQLWDSDRFTADDDLGRVEVDLKELMHSSNTKNKISEREDRFKGQDPGENMPGTLSWSVGYFAKTPITDQQLAKQTVDKQIKSKEELKKNVSEIAERKLREATAHDESKEINQQKAQDYKEKEDAMICAAPPDSGHPSGILSIQIHNITGLEVEQLQKEKKDDDEEQSENEEGMDLPSSYCTIILNQKKIYMTRTKPKNAKPFFNAGTERFIRDWRTAEIMISVRDSRERENDALLGIVYLPLKKMFQNRSQVMDLYPLVGGVGYGRARISMMFRSVEMQLPQELLGWDVGTLEIKSPIKPMNLPQDINSHRIKLRSNIAKVKMISEDGEWRFKGSKKSDFLACTKRYATPLVVEFRKSQIGTDSTAAFAVFWLRDIPDEEEKTLTLAVWKGGKENFKKATTCSDYQGLNGEKPLGEIQLTIKFWRGLSGYHKNHAQSAKNSDMRNVMEVLDTVNDECQSDSESSSGSDSDSDSDSDSSTEDKNTSKHLKTHTNQDSDGEDSDGGRGIINKVKARASDLLGENDSEDGERGVRGQMSDYKKHHKQLHRKHRGIMQWKGARTADWALEKVRNGKSKVKGVFEHEEKGGGIETEV
ncbi:hypothetical protein VTL71DRAFT_801 [Oculimacula yallundae]|uniref:Uncharacterized protein n=1 Tax=Oculimacula yallundae TaxID=86028 RepID=A0ABR4D125_9HELO